MVINSRIPSLIQIYRTIKPGIRTFDERWVLHG